MGDVLASIGIVALALIGFSVVLRAVWDHFEAEKRKAVAGCKHEWEPWAEPKDVDVKETETAYYDSIGWKRNSVAKEFVGKFQDRVCSKCNIYERRWC